MPTTLHVWVLSYHVTRLLPPEISSPITQLPAKWRDVWAAHICLPHHDSGALYHWKDYKTAIHTGHSNIRHEAVTLNEQLPLAVSCAFCGFIPFDASPDGLRPHSSVRYHLAYYQCVTTFTQPNTQVCLFDPQQWRQSWKHWCAEHQLRIRALQVIKIVQPSRHHATLQTLAQTPHYI